MHMTCNIFSAGFKIQAVNLPKMLLSEVPSTLASKSRRRQIVHFNFDASVDEPLHAIAWENTVYL